MSSSSLNNGDVADAGTMDALVDRLEWAERRPELAPLQPNRTGLGRELFALMRGTADDAERGASAMLHALDAEAR